MTHQQTAGLDIGQQAPQFTLPNIDGASVSLRDFATRPVGIIFMCNHCPYVREHIDHIAQLQQMFDEQGVPVIGISSNDAVAYPQDSFEAMKQLARTKGLLYYCYDQTQQVARSFHATCTPQAYVLDKHHRVTYRGALIDDKKQVFREALEHTIAGKPLSHPITTARGCSIKWRQQ